MTTRRNSKKSPNGLTEDRAERPGSRSLLFLLLLLILLFPLADPLEAGPVSTSKFGPYFLTQQRLGNGLWHFRISIEEPDSRNPWINTPMLAQPSYWVGPHDGPESVLNFTALETPTPSLSITEVLPDESQSEVFRIVPFAPENQLAGLSIYGDRYTHVVGLGADFRFTFSKIDHLGRVVMPGGPFGSIIESSFGTRASGIHAPVMFALGQGFQNAAIFINETRPLAWDFSSRPWYVGPTGPLGPNQSIEFFVILGKDMPALRRILMNLLGRPAIPPKSVFSPWIITKDKLPYQSYNEVLAELALNKGPFSTLSLMFQPHPDNPPISEAVEQGMNILITESPYIPIDSPYFSDMAKRGFLVRDGGPAGSPLLVNYHGKRSGLIDYSHPPASTYWDSLGRQALIMKGARLFNLAGGEPEIYSPTAWYQGGTGDRIHSQYAWGPRFALKWMEGFYSAPEMAGFGRFQPRLFTVSRAGLAGMGRFGAGVLTFEPDLLFVYNAAQARANLILSGVDYYSTDISQLFENFPSSQDYSNPMYQSWLANQVLLNLPLVLPLEILKTPWAKFNLDLKASLEPYYYSLAYNSSRTGEPLVAPMLYYFQDDPLARESDFETMVGPYLLVAAGVNPAMEILDFNLPVGRWYDLLNQDLIVKEKGDGTSSSNIKPQRGFPGDSKDKVRNISLPAKTKGFSVAPVLARAGSIIPMISDPSGPRRRRSVLVFPGDAPTSFVLYDDNGKDYDYQDGQYSTIVFELEPATAETPVRLTIKAKQGSFPEEDRNYQLWVEFVGLGNIGTASLDGENYKRANSEELLHSLEAGWFSLGDGRVIFKTPQMEPTQDHYIVLN